MTHKLRTANLMAIRNDGFGSLLPLQSMGGKVQQDNLSWCFHHETRLF